MSSVPTKKSSLSEEMIDKLSNLEPVSQPASTGSFYIESSVNGSPVNVSNIKGCHVLLNPDPAKETENHTHYQCMNDKLLNDGVQSFECGDDNFKNAHDYCESINEGFYSVES